MNEYLMIGNLLGIFSFLELLKNDKYLKFIKKYLGYFFIVFLIFFAGLRENVGYDYEGYLNIFKNGLKENIEIGYKYLNIIFFKLGFKYFLLIISIFLILTKYLYLKKRSKYLLISLFIYYSEVFLIKDFGQIRQGIVISLFIWINYYYIKKKINIYTYELLIILCSFIHMSALLLMIYPILYKLIKRMKKFLVFLILIFYIVGRNINLHYCLNVLYKITNNFYLKSKITFLKSSHYINPTEINLYFISKITILILVVLFFSKKNEKLIEFEAYIAGWLVFFMFFSMKELAVRYYQYTFIFEAIILTEILSKTKLKIVTLSIIIFYYLYMIKTLSYIEGYLYYFIR